MGRTAFRRGNRVRLRDPASGKVGVLTYTVLGESADGKLVTIISPSSPSLGGAREKRVPPENLVVAKTAGQIADDHEADMQAARDGYNPNW